MSEGRLKGKQLIENSEWATCYICEAVFRRKRYTKRYCGECHNGYCEGEHGSFAPYSARGGPPQCIICSSGGNPDPLMELTS